jgi:UDP:flavonoid glycosyltransferase YjiC (YdhE family)
MHILFVCENVTLAHLTRSLALIDLIVNEGSKISLSADILEQDIRSAPFNLNPRVNFIRINSISRKKFNLSITWGMWPYTSKTLDKYVNTDLALLKLLKPDLVIADFRLSIPTSCEFLDIPYLYLVNAYWKKESQGLGIPVPSYKSLNLLPLKLAQRIFNITTPLILELYLSYINKIRKKLLLTCYLSFDQFFCAGINGIYPDSKLLISFDNNAELLQDQFLGPIAWNPKSQINIKRNQDQKLIYLALGSSSSKSINKKILKVLATLPVQVIISSSESCYRTLVKSKNFYFHSFIDGKSAAAQADLVICNGGSPSTYQALSVGTPVLGLPENLDQYLCMYQFSHHKCVNFLRSERASKDQISKKIIELLNDPMVKQSAEYIKLEFEQYDIKKNLMDKIMSLTNYRDCRRA